MQQKGTIVPTGSLDLELVLDLVSRSCRSLDLPVDLV
jgi:hypothetical protein